MIPKRHHGSNAPKKEMKEIGGKSRHNPKKKHRKSKRSVNSRDLKNVQMKEIASENEKLKSLGHQSFGHFSDKFGVNSEVILNKFDLHFLIKFLIKRKNEIKELNKHGISEPRVCTKNNNVVIYEKSEERTFLNDIETSKKTSVCDIFFKEIKTNDVESLNVNFLGQNCTKVIQKFSDSLSNNKTNLSTNFILCEDVLKFNVCKEILQSSSGLYSFENKNKNKETILNPISFMSFRGMKKLSKSKRYNKLQKFRKKIVQNDILYYSLNSSSSDNDNQLFSIIDQQNKNVDAQNFSAVQFLKIPFVNRKNFKSRSNVQKNNENLSKAINTTDTDTSYNTKLDNTSSIYHKHSRFKRYDEPTPDTIHVDSGGCLQMDKYPVDKESEMNSVHEAQLRHMASQVMRGHSHHKRGNVHVVETTVTIIVKDINDNAPIFPNATIYGDVQENGPIGKSFVYINYCNYQKEPHPRAF